MTTLALFTIILAVSLATAGLAVMYLSRDRADAPRTDPVLSSEQLVFLFDGEDLIDATDPARNTLSTAPGDGSDFERLAGFLRSRFPTLRRDLPGAADFGIKTLTSDANNARIEAERIHGMLRISLIDDGPVDGGAIDAPSFTAITDELASLRTAVEYLPYLVWKETPQGTVTWVNSAYLAQVRAVLGDDAAGRWPPPRLFEESAAAPNDVHRAHLDDGDGGTLWFDHSSVPLDDEVLHMALPADATVKAETTLRDFLQTLTKTFAHLTVGLAIFDKNRRLFLFNPALTDLTALDGAFLCERPHLSEMLDRLREKRMMPEPKDYKTWRQRIAELEAAAVEGTYVETWSLPGGQTYRVSGRPHPDGAIAFVFEDISAEISLTRRFRSELATSQAVIDTMEEAIAVFSSNGILTLSNRAYADLWGLDPSVTLGQISVTDATRHWSDRCDPSPVWGDIRNFVCGMGERAEWTEPVTRVGGAPLTCRIVPIAGGSTLVGFAPRTPPAAEQRLDSFRTRRLTA